MPARFMSVFHPFTISPYIVFSVVNPSVSRHFTILPDPIGIVNPLVFRWSAVCFVVEPIPFGIFMPARFMSVFHPFTISPYIVFSVVNPSVSRHFTILPDPIGIVNPLVFRWSAVCFVVEPIPFGIFMPARFMSVFHPFTISPYVVFVIVYPSVSRHFTILPNPIGIVNPLVFR